MENPKLVMMKFLFNRPTVPQAFGQCVIEYLRQLEGDPKVPKAQESLEGMVLQAIKERNSERGKDTT
jgi:hypothetical protein